MCKGHTPAVCARACVRQLHSLTKCECYPPFVENRFFANFFDSTLHAVIRKSAERPNCDNLYKQSESVFVSQPRDRTVTTSVNRVQVLIHDCCWSRWCMLLTTSVTNALAVSRDQTVSQLRVDFESSGVPMLTNLNQELIRLAFDGQCETSSPASSPACMAHVGRNMTSVYQRIEIFGMVLCSPSPCTLHCCAASYLCYFC